ncbi:MAG: hypothetical protein E7472_00725 [Ruminococcaceae bacterium]|nr:hypothetical protein [Oscillospiraceae bacterium]
MRSIAKRKKSKKIAAFGRFSTSFPPALPAGFALRRTAQATEDAFVFVAWSKQRNLQNIFQKFVERL